MSSNMSHSQSSPVSPSSISSAAPCGICDLPVTWSMLGISCDTCGLWFHIDCQNINTSSYDRLGGEDVAWTCAFCKSNNYSLTPFDLHPYTTVNSLSFSSDVDAPFDPLHSSTPTRQSKQDKHTNRPLRVLNINFQSARGKVAEIHNLLLSTKPDILIGTETWLDQEINTCEIFPREYSVYRRDRPSRGGGVLIAVRDGLSSVQEPLPSHPDCELLWVRVKLKRNRNLLVGAFYRPDVTDKVSVPLMKLSAEQAMQSRNSIVILGGDFNFPGLDWTTRTLKSGASCPGLHHQFLDTLADLGLEQVIEQPTRGENTLDLMCISHPNLVPRTETMPGVSDHCIVYLELQLSAVQERQVQRPMPCYNKADWPQLKASISNLSSSVMDNFTPDSNPEEIWTTLRDGILESVQQYIPHRLLCPKRSLPWVDYKTRKLIRRRDRIHKKWKKTNNPALLEAFRSLKSEIQKRLRKQFWNFTEELITVPDDAPDQPQTTKKFWSYVKQKRTEHSGVAPLKVNGKLVTDDREKAEVLNGQFQSAFSAREPLTEEEFAERCPMPPLDDITPCADIVITQAGVLKLLKALDPSKASGPDNISPRVLKEVAEEISPAVTLLFQASLNTGVVPGDWRTALVTPVFKKGERYKAENYRPISLTSVTCKLLEHIVVKSIMGYAEDNNIVCPQQHGFRRGHSCESQLLGFVDEASEAMERGHQEDVIVLDFSKAFDKVSHSLLVHKLRHYRIAEKTCRWIENFLLDRTQAVVVGGAKSDPIPVQSGVPQGSAVGPSLFVLYINDLPSGLASTVRLFADDTMCHNEIAVQADQHQLQEDLTKLASWEERWCMSFHPEKCTTMHMTRRRTTLQETYTLHGHHLQCVTEAKYLGVTISADLKWDTHINNTVGRANKTMGFLRRNLKTRNKRVKERAYKALVRPLLEYASPVWDPVNNNSVDSIEKVQRRAARWVSQDYRQSTRSEDLLTKLEWPLLQTRRTEARLNTLYKFHHGLLSINTQFPPTTNQQKRSRRQTNSLAYDVPSHRTQYRQSTFFPRTIPQWNCLPEEVASAPTLSAFKGRLQKHFK